MNNPLRYINSWPAVTFACFAIAGIVGIFALAGPDERITFLAIASGLATLFAAIARQAFAMPPPKPPKRLGDGCPVGYLGDDGQSYRCAALHAAGPRACCSPNPETKAHALRERAASPPVPDRDDDDGDAGGEVLADDDGPPTTPRPRAPVRVTHHPRATVKESLTARLKRPFVLLTAAFVLALSVPFFVTGCSSSALQTHATTALIARHTLDMTHDAIEVTCATLARECADDACLAARESECAAASHAQDAAVAAVLTYADAIELAALADEGQVMATLRFALDSAARAWTEAGLRLATIGISLPSIGGL